MYPTIGKKELLKTTMKRKAFEGVKNIIRFNRHFYLAAFIIILTTIILSLLFTNYKLLLLIISLLLAFPVANSLFVSWYVYDVSTLYSLGWLNEMKDNDEQKILNIHAGFDETSSIINNKFPKSKLITCDFYNEKKQTETSIKRAQKFTDPLVNVIKISTDSLPFSDNYFDFTTITFSAHEIRNEQERIRFFEEAKRVTKGLIFVTEHLRDLPNFLAYTIGFFHFYSKTNWYKTFALAKLHLNKKIKTTPFITTFILNKNGDTI